MSKIIVYLAAFVVGLAMMLSPVYAREEQPRPLNAITQTQAHGDQPYWLKER